MKNSIGKPCEGKLQARFDEGGADSLVNFTNLVRNLTELSGSTLLGNLNIMSVKELLILFLIDKHSSLNNIYSLTRIFDRADFPSDVSNVLKVLMSSKLIEYAENRPLNKMQVYKSTVNGKKLLESNFNQKETLDYINTLEDPKFLYELTELLLNKG
ncbi:hypothetical protein [Aquimarina aquimarini]|uniref:hypothetical protein n=1 Tax=Aquimarina aquimarini TaxID=1191734 RepID=UPI000D560423|nr:hypothetical protein [Aquimarina aquimarini]